MSNVLGPFLALLAIGATAAESDAMQTIADLRTQVKTQVAQMAEYQNENAQLRKELSAVKGRRLEENCQGSGGLFEANSGSITNVFPGGTLIIEAAPTTTTNPATGCNTSPTTPVVTWGGETLTAVETTDVLTVGGRTWEQGRVSYQSVLTTYCIVFPMIATTDINTSNGNEMVLHQRTKVYMLRNDGPVKPWNAVPLDGWSKQGTDNFLGSAYGSITSLYTKTMEAGTYSMDNDSAMYLFESV
jgi:hypothetical protein